MKYEVVDAMPDHIDAIARNVRQADIDEIWATAAILPRDALRISLENADLARTWLVDGVPAAMGGVGKGGVIWLIVSDLIDHHAHQFLTESFREFEKARQHYGLLFNYVDARNHRAIRWLKWLNFTFEGPFPYGVFRKLFFRFYWERETRKVA